MFQLHSITPHWQRVQHLCFTVATLCLWLNNQTVVLSQSFQATTEFQYIAYCQSTDQSLPFSSHWELRWMHSITTFSCTQETRLVEDIKLRQEVGGHVYLHCNKLITLNLAFTCSWSVIWFLLSYLFLNKAGHTFSVSEIWSYTLICFCPGWTWHLIILDTRMHCFE